ncbi:MAG TPA: inositol-3-phosphate synthase [Polyangiaceae bacterium]|jgi:myo-inositol-1-phosphate synthase
MKKLGVCIVGLHGAVATTIVAGVHMMVKGLAPRYGMVTEKTPGATAESIADWLDFAPVEGLVFAGWDPRFKNAYEGAVHHKVFQTDQLRAVKEQLETTVAWPAVIAKNGKTPEGNFVMADNIRDQIEIIKKNITEFKAKNGLDHVVLVNLASTEQYLDEAPAHKTLAAFEKAIDANDKVINAAMRYFYAANELGVPYVNFTPSLTNVPALAEHAEKKNNPYAGMDGKTGQTLVKTALGSMFRVRRLHVDGWYSTNILGNNDGAVLADPEACKTKVLSKQSCLDSVLGYHVENHQVHIHYYKPRGDSKEAWDNIDLVGFGGIPMQMKIDFLCQDSALAAPVVLDLVRIIDVAKQNGEKGIQRQMSLFFKSPYAAPGEAPVHDLFKQEKLLLDWAQNLSKKTAR